jgi:hypothetical protein
VGAAATGLRKSAEVYVRGAATVCIERFWTCWNRFIAQPLQLNAHKTHKPATDQGIFATSASGGMRLGGGLRSRATAVTTLERRDALEKRLTAIECRHDEFRNQYGEETGKQLAAIDREATERTDADKRLDEQLANAVGGDLRLHTWGVVCLCWARSSPRSGEDAGMGR